jgi:hypothetical protein
MIVESRFAATLVIDKRTPQVLREAVADFAERTDHKPPKLIMTDENVSYEPALRAEYGKMEVVRRKDGEADGRCKPRCSWPEGCVYATVSKSYTRGKPSAIKRKLVHGTEEQLRKALDESKASTTINTAFIERQNGTDRTHNARKVRETLCFSKDLLTHLAVSWWVMLCYNFHFVHRGLRIELGPRQVKHRTPAMAQGLIQRPLSVADIVFTPVAGLPRVTQLKPSYFKPWKRARLRSAQEPPVP